VDIQAQLHEAHNEKAQAHVAKSNVQDPIQDLNGSMTRGNLRKTQEVL